MIKVVNEQLQSSVKRSYSFLLEIYPIRLSTVRIGKLCSLSLSSHDMLGDEGDIKRECLNLRSQVFSR